MEYHPERPLVVQNDRTIFVEVAHPDYTYIRDKLHMFAELVKSPEYIHTYSMTPLTLWNAAASGHTASEILQLLADYVKFPLSDDLRRSIEQDMGKYGTYRLVEHEDDRLCLVADKVADLERLLAYSSLSDCFAERPAALDTKGITVKRDKRGELKQRCIQLGWPIKDEAGFRDGERLTVPLLLNEELEGGTPFSLRPYQSDAVQAFTGGSRSSGGHGVLVLPCGAGKTIIGLGAITHYQTATLILTTNQTSVKQWKRELLEKTNLPKECVGEYTGERKEIADVTVATYQVLTYRASREAEFEHMNVFQQKHWGLIIYDEVHLLPAPVFRATADIQSTRRLGLTATLIREDGREKDVFSLIGPKRYDVPWKTIEQQGFIAKAFCTEVRIGWEEASQTQYYMLPSREKTRYAQENPQKTAVVRALLTKHEGASILIIGAYVDQLLQLGTELGVPVITGQTKQPERERLYDQFRRGNVPVLIVSKVANFAVDLPDASVAIQISGTYGSRQEEAQRLGRILRPKRDHEAAFFYHVVTKDTKDQEFAAKRQRFLVEQGYQYSRIEM